MRKLRILLLIHKFTQGGAEQQLYELAQGLNKERFEVIVGSLVEGGTKWSEFQALNGVKVFCFGQKHRFDFWVLLRIISFLRKFPVDVLHAYLAPAAFFGTLAGIIARVPVLIIGERGTAPSFPTLGSMIYFGLETMVARWSDLVIANSLAGKEWKIKTGFKADRVVVIYNGLNPARLAEKVRRTRSELGIGASDPVLGIVARLAPMKDHLTLFEAVDSIRKEYPNLRCLLVGDGSSRGQLEQYVRENNLSGNVLFLGHQDHACDFIRLFDVAVLSSKDTEGCSNFLLEAMYCSKPIVATDVGGSRELVTHRVNGFLVGKGDPEALARAVLELLKNRQLGNMFAKVGRLRVEQEFMLGHMIGKTEAVYEKLVWDKLGAVYPNQLQDDMTTAMRDQK
jgi:glycosyltransferase involved in cell wall biosynthesis